MSEAIYYELLLLAASLAVGIGLMIAYDGLRLLRALIPHGSLWTGMEDAAYWLISSAVTFLLLFYQNDGILRWYAIGGVLSGMLAYNATVSRIYRSLLKKAEKYFTMRKQIRCQKKKEKAEREEKRRLEKKKREEKGTGARNHAGEQKNEEKEKR